MPDLGEGPSRANSGKISIQMTDGTIYDCWVDSCLSEMVSKMKNSKSKFIRITGDTGNKKVDRYVNYEMIVSFKVTWDLV